jgi:hypothetical protein
MCGDFGHALENVGDLDGDGFPELAVAGGGSVWVFSCRSGALVHELGAPLLHGIGGAGPDFSIGIAGGLDADGDGRPDLVIHGRSHDWRTKQTRSVVGLYSGSDGRLLRVFGRAEDLQDLALDGVVQHRLDSGLLGAGIALLPDRDGDGGAELALTVLDVELGDGMTGDSLDVIEPWTGCVLQRTLVPRPGAWIVRDPGDVDRDGTSDVLLSVVDSYVLTFSGADGRELTRHSWVGGYRKAEGSSLDVAGDQDGDGVNDYLVGANEDSLDCDPGFVRMYSGIDGRVLNELVFDHGDDPRTTCGVGADTCAVGDVDGDGRSDVVVHVPRLEQVRLLSGATFEEIWRVEAHAIFEADDAR